MAYVKVEEVNSQPATVRLGVVIAEDPGVYAYVVHWYNADDEANGKRNRWNGEYTSDWGWALTEFAKRARRLSEPIKPIKLG